MENEEKEDLLLEVTESDDEGYEKEEIDYYIEKKILDFIQNEKPDPKSGKKTLIFITTCLFMFLSSSVLVVALPIYLKCSSATSISSYSKLVTLSLVNAVFFALAHIVGALSKCASHAPPSYNLCLGDVLKVSFLLSAGSVSIFWLADGNYVSCHLKDPLKGCCLVFSLLFYFVFSRRKMSLERTFCAITIAVGVFVSVDFGICDKFKCNGNSNLSEATPKFHFVYVVLYLAAHGLWVLHLTFVEVCWTTSKDPNLNVSVLSNVSSGTNPGNENIKPSIQSLSIICQEEEEAEMASRPDNLPKSRLASKSSFSSKGRNSKTTVGRASENSLNSCGRNRLSVPDFRKFPLTSTPNNEPDGWHSWTSGRCYDLALWQHITCSLLVLALCWLPTLSLFHDGKGKLLVEVISEGLESLSCHAGLSSEPKCGHLPVATAFVSTSYVIFTLTSIEVLKTAQSAVTVVSILMSALPVASLFWSLFQIGESCSNILEFDPEISGEAVCAVLGLPIIGIGVVLLLKSHIREFRLAM